MRLVRVCGRCGSVALSVKHVTTGYWRKECTACGSTGPFRLESRDGVSPSGKERGE